MRAGPAVVDVAEAGLPALAEPAAGPAPIGTVAEVAGLRERPVAPAAETHAAGTLRACAS